MRLRCNLIGRHKIVRQTIAVVAHLRHCLLVDERSISQQLKREYIDLFLGPLPGANHVPKIMMREARLNAVRCVIGKRQGNRTCRRDRGMVRETRTDLGQLFYKLRRLCGNTLHVAAIARMQQPPGKLVTGLVAVGHHLRALPQHFLGNLELFVHDWRRAFFLCQRQCLFPPGKGQFASDFFCEADSFTVVITHA